MILTCLSTALLRLVTSLWTEKSSLVDEDADLYEDLYGEEMDEDMGYDGQLKAAFYSRNNIYYFN